MPDFRLSGGELPPNERDAFHEMRKRVHAQPDVHNVLGLSHSQALGGWFYWIATPFATWPRYVIGFTDANLSEMRIHCRTSVEYEAAARWLEICEFNDLEA